MGAIKGRTALLALLSLLVPLGCAALDQEAAARDVRDDSISRVTYGVSAPVLWDAVGGVLKKAGYQPGTLQEGALGTAVRCHGDTCDSVKVTVRSVDGKRRQLFARRSSYEGGNDIQVSSTDRAFDIEWVVLRQVDPKLASAIETNARQEAGEAQRRLETEGRPLLFSGIE